MNRGATILASFVAGAIVALLWCAAWWPEPETRQLAPIRVVEVEPGVWACTQGDRVVPCHFGDGGDTFERSQ